MGHLLILIKVDYHQNTLTSLEFSNYPIFDQKICFRNFWKGHNNKDPAGFELMSYRFLVNALTQKMILYLILLLQPWKNFFFIVFKNRYAYIPKKTIIKVNCHSI